MKKFALIGSILGAIGVSIGAFGAHAFKEFLVFHQKTDTFETATKYLFYHAIVLLFIGTQPLNKWYNRAAYSLILGILIFSGSLYLICFTLINAFGAFAPIGGLLLIGGWIMLALGLNHNEAK